jgi:hypothetical protein
MWYTLFFAREKCLKLFSSFLQSAFVQVKKCNCSEGENVSQEVEYQMERLDHVVIVAEVCREAGIAEWLDERAGEQRRSVSLGPMDAHHTDLLINVPHGTEKNQCRESWRSAGSLHIMT